MSQIFYRNATLEQKDIDLEKGIVRLSFSSELRVKRKDKRGYYYEELSHQPGDCNLGFLNRSGMVLADHDETQEIGTVEPKSALVEADGKCRATIKVDDADWQARIKAEAISIPVSVGYRILSELSATREPEGDGITIRKYSWEPYEISLLTGPAADNTVGIYRSKKRLCPDCEGEGCCPDCGDDEERSEECATCKGKGRCSGCAGNGYISTARAVDLNKNAEAEKNLRTKNMETITAEQLSAAKIEAAKLSATETAARNKDIITASEMFVERHGKKAKGEAAKEIRKMAIEAIEKGFAADKFNASVTTYCLNLPPEQINARDFVPAEDMAQFSLSRAIQQAITNKDKGGAARPDKDSVEGSIISEYERKLSQAEGGRGSYTPVGFCVPLDAQIGMANLSRKEMLREYRKNQNTFGRDMQATVYGAGGAVVPTYWLLPVIELLRNKLVLSRAGVRVMGGLTGNVIIPRLEAPSTAYSLAEIAAITNSQQTLGQISMTPHRIGNRVVYSKQLVFQSSPDIERLINDDMLKVLALKADLLGLVGQGAGSEPLGIFNTPGISNITFGATPTYTQIVQMETDIREQNVMDSLTYVSTSATRGSLKTVAEVLRGASSILGGSYNALWKGVGQTGEMDGEMNGWPAIDSQQIPAPAGGGTTTGNQMLLGAFEQFIMGIFGGFDVVIDYYTQAANAEVAVNMNMWLDYVMRHPQAFCASTDSAAQ